MDPNDIDVAELIRLFEEFIRTGSSEASERKKMVETIKAGTQKLKSAFATIAQASTQVGSEFKHLDTAIDGTTAAVGAFAKAIPVLGGALGGAVDALGKAAKFYTAQLDSLGSAYQSVASVGGAAGDGIKDLAERANAAGLSFDRYAGLISKNAQSLAVTFNSTTDGMKLLADYNRGLETITDGTSTLRNRFFQLGLTVEEQSEYMVDWANLQKRMTGVQIRDARTLAMGTKAYVEELDGLARLTGKSRAALKAEQENATRDERFGFTLQATKDVNLRKQMQDLYIGAGVLGQKAQAGVADSLSGALNTEAAKGLSLATGGKSVELFSQFREGLMSYEEVLVGLKDAIVATRENFGGAEFLQIVGKTNSSIESIMEIFLLVNEQSDLTVEKVRATTAKSKTETGKMTKNFADAQENVLAMTRSLNSAFIDTLPKATEYLSTFTTVIAETFKTLADALEGKGKIGEALVAAGLIKQKIKPFSTTEQGIREEGLREKYGKGRFVPYHSSMLNFGGPSDENYNPAIHDQQIKEHNGYWVQDGAKIRKVTKDQKAMVEKNLAAYKPLLDEIAGGEAVSGSYDSLVGGKIKEGASSMTIADILKFQESTGKQSAIGRYQFQKDTIQEMIKSGLISETDTFSPEQQDLMAALLVERRRRDDSKAFANNLAFEWAALQGSHGRGMYDNDGVNHSSVGFDKIVSKLPQPMFAKGGVASGPLTGYQAMLHGNEAVVPLPDGRTIPVEIRGGGMDVEAMREMTASMKKMVEMAEMQLDRMDRLQSSIREGTDISKRILQHSRS